MTGPRLVLTFSQPGKDQTGLIQTGLWQFFPVQRLVLTGYSLNQSATGLDQLY